MDSAAENARAAALKLFHGFLEPAYIACDYVNAAIKGAAAQAGYVYPTHPLSSLVCGADATYDAALEAGGSTGDAEQAVVNFAVDCADNHVKDTLTLGGHGLLQSYQEGQATGDFTAFNDRLIGIYAGIGLGLGARRVGPALDRIVDDGRRRIAKPGVPDGQKLTFSDPATLGTALEVNAAALAPKPDLHRPYIRNAVRAEVEWRARRAADGRPLDLNTSDPIVGKPDLGHIFGREYRRELAKAEAEGLTQSQFNDRMNNPDLYQLEDPASNRSHCFEKPGNN